MGAQEVKPAFYQQTAPGDGKSVYDSGLGFGSTPSTAVWADHDTSTPSVISLRTATPSGAIRRPPCEPYPWDGAGNVQPFQGLGTSVVEGVY